MNLFENGSVAVDPLKLFGNTFDDPASQMVLAAVAFALVALVVIAIRRGRLGRRLLAMKDSEAACATLGLNLLGTKLTVFALSAGIAGFGGALYAMQLTSITPSNFELVSSLQIFALTVVGGIGAVGGALFGAASLLVLLPLLVDAHPVAQPLGRPAPRRCRHRARPQPERRGARHPRGLRAAAARRRAVVAGDVRRARRASTRSGSRTSSTTGRS